MKYRIRIVTYLSGNIKYYAEKEVKKTFGSYFVSIDKYGTLDDCSKEYEYESSREKALERIDSNYRLHLSETVKEIQIEYIIK